MYVVLRTEQVGENTLKPENCYSIHLQCHHVGKNLEDYISFFYHHQTIPVQQTWQQVTFKILGMLSCFLIPSSVIKIGDKQEDYHLLFWILYSTVPFMEPEYQKGKKSHSSLYTTVLLYEVD